MTRRDVVTAGIIAVVMVLAAVAVLFSGSAARSGLSPAEAEQPEYGPATGRPTSIQPLWTHESDGSGPPLTTKGNLVTVSADGVLVGRDAGSGEERWSYTHAGRFCAAVFYSDSLAAAFDGTSGCSDVTSLDPTTQEYESTRLSAFPETMDLTGTWKHALAFSPDRLEIWRDDLVRTVEYGAVEAPQEAGMQPRAGCTLLSADLTDERFAVSERCPGDDSVRLTLSKTVPEDNRKPEEIASDPTGADGLWVIDVAEDGVLALRNEGPAWTVEWFTSPTEHRTVHTLEGGPAVPFSRGTVSGDGDQVRWFDGGATHAFDRSTGEHSWTVGGVTGPGLTGGWTPDPEASAGGDWVLVPVPGGLALLDHETGVETRRLPTTATQDRGVTGLAQIGDILYERRAGAIHAYKLVV
ncbi:PQQ-binding-like beta-propeller repeat protein [Dietzia sp. PP-33]|jgi:outer membrane protein assembly factor BamB|uniref:Rv3212 family protein n=1 Tax=Dietzia sp. PP-33 TaxID=2957500 RepID=UPI0029BBCD3D|nr:PQQ-binding-like beta-propeller repeat protein [Dietzia sp. PP-33]MDX2356656.1 PQQ-like beta-propeller repeat protein [Dietzia sp. PP-33]